MVVIKNIDEITIEAVEAVAFGEEKLEIDPLLLEQVASGRRHFERLIAAGVPCYGVTTGLGDLVHVSLSETERLDLPHNILRARAAAVGPPLPRPVVRATMMIKLFNFLSGRDGVTVELCRFLVDRLNDGFTPWVPSLGHGMAADAIAQTHLFQTFIGEGYTLTMDGLRQPAADSLAERGVSPLRLAVKEGLALLNGLGAAPAYALFVLKLLHEVFRLASATAAVSCAGAAVPHDSFDLHLQPLTRQAGTRQVMAWLAHLLDKSRLESHILQAPVSFRIIPQVHGALLDALQQFAGHIEAAIQTFSDNPLMTFEEDHPGGRFLSVGSFHNQHLANHADLLAIALTHVASLSVRRLHRLLDQNLTGLNPQLAGRPGLDAGLVVAHKAALGLETRLKQLASPVSIHTGESSAGQEDYMAMTMTGLLRLEEMVEPIRFVLAYELLGGITAMRQRGGFPGTGVEQIITLLADIVPNLDRDRPPGPIVEGMAAAFCQPPFQNKLKELFRAP